MSDGWNPIQKYWHEPTQSNRDALRALLKTDFTRLQYEHGVTDPSASHPMDCRSTIII